MYSFEHRTGKAQPSPVSCGRLIAGKYSIFLRVSPPLSYFRITIIELFYRISCLLVVNNLMAVVCRSFHCNEHPTILTSLVLLERVQILFLGSGLGAWLPSNILERTECKANSPFHAAMGIATSRMFIHLRKFSTKNLDGPVDSYQERDSLAPVEFANRPDLRESFDTDDSSTEGFHDLESIAGSSRHSHSLSVSLSIYTIFVRCLTYF